jgi:hypothetical protein
MTTNFSLRGISIFALAIISGAILTANLPSPATVRPVELPALPPSLVVPAELPSTITDPAVLVAWIQLYNHTAPIPLWDGRTLTGRELAQFLLDEHIPVVWDVDNVCGGGSCSVQHFSRFGWVFDGQAPGVDPIYIRPALQTDPAGLLMVLAHEIFHRTQPFGAVADTKFEEYWGFRVGDAVAPAAWPVFDGYDALQTQELGRWVDVNNIGAYNALPAYPASVQGLVVNPPQARAPHTLSETELQILAEAGLITLAAETTPTANALSVWPGQ